MKDVAALLHAADTLTDESVLVTLVKIKGSAYRRPGARMLVLPGCRTVGTISGGCLEPLVARQAWEATRNGRRAILEIESAPEDDAWGPASGCHGILFLLAEPIAPNTRHPALEALAKIRAGDQPALLIHEFDIQPDGALLPGNPPPRFSHSSFNHSNLIRHSSFVIRISPPGATSRCSDPCLPDSPTSLHPSPLPNIRIEYLPANDRRPSTWRDESPTRAAFLEYVPPLPHLLICGAGDDAIPVARIAAELGWRITVADSRARFATRERFPAAGQISTEGPAALPALLRRNTAAVVMSHRFGDDVDYLAELLRHEAIYIGLLGPRRRAERLLAELADRPVPTHATPEQLARIFSPVGLDLGAEAPEAIALAIVAEIQAALADRDARPLTEKVGPIQMPEQPPSQIPTQAPEPGTPCLP